MCFFFVALSLFEFFQYSCNALLSDQHSSFSLFLHGYSQRAETVVQLPKEDIESENIDLYQRV